MPFDVPDLADVRRLNRDNLAAFLPGADASVPNSALRVLSDQNAGGAYLNLLYLQWIAKNVLPDTAEMDWLDRWATILFGGRKAATFAAGTIAVTGPVGAILPGGSIYAAADGVQYQVGPADARVSDQATPVPATCLTAGAIGNRDPGTPLALTVAANLAAQASVVVMEGGADVEGVEDLRTRILMRLRQPPMGGAARDYEAWGLQLPGVTRVWVSPREVGPGTVTVRFALDGLRASGAGLPTPDDLALMRAYLDVVHPVTADVFVRAPLLQGIRPVIARLSNDAPATRLAITASVQAMLLERAGPGRTIYQSWVNSAIADAVGDGHYDLAFDDAVMVSKGHMATLASAVGGGIAYA